MADKPEWEEGDKSEEDAGILHEEYPYSKRLCLRGDVMDDIFEVRVYYPKDCKIHFDRPGHRVEIVIEKVKE
jgi:hypothetical protein